MAETEGLSRRLRQPILPNLLTSEMTQSNYADMRSEMEALRRSLVTDVQGIREYLNEQRNTLDDMYLRLAEQMNDTQVMTRLHPSPAVPTININSTSPVTITQITVHTTADTRVLLLGFCDMVLNSATADHNLIFEIHKGTVGGGLVGASQHIDTTSPFHQWPNITRGVDETPALEQTYIFTGRKDNVANADTDVFAVLLLGINTQKPGES